jgi:hypothetical protein
VCTNLDIYVIIITLTIKRKYPRHFLKILGILDVIDILRTSLINLEISELDKQYYLVISTIFLSIAISSIIFYFVISELRNIQE